MGTLAGVLCAVGAMWAGPAAPALPLSGLEAAVSIGDHRPAVVEAELSQIARRPWTWQGQPLRFEVVLDAVDVPFQPWLSSFGPRDWSALSVWSDDAELWNADVHAAPFARLFIDRGAADLGALRHAHRYERFRCWGVVREIHLGQPWIEVVRAEPLLEDLATGTVLHASRAVELWQQGQHALALGELERAQLAPMPAGHALRLGTLDEQWRQELKARPPLDRPRFARESSAVIYRLDIPPLQRREQR